ncbi:MAG: MFS transporter, partial [Methyloceanibacter sp.]
MMQALGRLKVTPLAWRLAFLYAALFFVVGCYLPYMPVWLHWRNLDADSIAFLLATPLFARTLFTPVISFAADWSGARRAVLIFLAWGSLLSFLLLWASGSFWQMFLATLLLALSWTTIMPLIETVAVSGIRSA